MPFRNLKYMIDNSIHYNTLAKNIKTIYVILIFEFAKNKLSTSMITNLVHVVKLFMAIYFRPISSTN